eukprot:gene23563-biopygen2050
MLDVNAQTVVSVKWLMVTVANGGQGSAQNGSSLEEFEDESEDEELLELESISPGLSCDNFLESAKFKTEQIPSHRQRTKEIAFFQLFHDFSPNCALKYAQVDDYLLVMEPDHTSPAVL